MIEQIRSDPLGLPKVSFQTDFQLNLFWHLIAKYGDVVPMSPTVLSSVNLKYRIENAATRSPRLVRLLRSLAYKTDGWAIFEPGFLNAATAQEKSSSQFDKYQETIRESLKLEEDSFRTIYGKERGELERFRYFLGKKWKEYGNIVLSEYSRLTNEDWIQNRIDAFLVTGCLDTGMFRRNYLVLPYFRNFDKGFCILIHLLARYLVTDKVLDVLYSFTGPSQDLYLDAIYGLLVNQVLLKITKNWTDFNAPVEPKGGQEYKIFQSLLPYWREHVERGNETFDTFLKRRIASDFISNETLTKNRPYRYRKQLSS